MTVGAVHEPPLLSFWGGQHQAAPLGGYPAPPVTPFPRHWGRPPVIPANAGISKPECNQLPPSRRSPRHAVPPPSFPRTRESRSRSATNSPLTPPLIPPKAGIHRALSERPPGNPVTPPPPSLRPPPGPPPPRHSEPQRRIQKLHPTAKRHIASRAPLDSSLRPE